MSYQEIIGVLSESKQCDGSLLMEWKIPKFVGPLLARVDSFYRSSSFLFENVYWHLRVHVKTKDISLSVYLKNEDLFMHDVTYSCSIKKSDGTLAWTQTCASALSNYSDSHPFLFFCLGNETKFEILPSDALIIVCNLKSDVNVEGTLTPTQIADKLSEKSRVGTLECVKLTGNEIFLIYT